MASDLLDDLDHVLIEELVLLPHLLGIELDRSSPHHGVAELADHVPMDAVAEAFNRGVHAWENDRGLVIRILTLGLRVHPDQIQILPHLLHQFV